jgi:hypothetical protein
MWPHPDNAWSRVVCPLGRDKIQEARAWIWAIARAHKVNAENVLEIRGEQASDVLLRVQRCDELFFSI